MGRTKILEEPKQFGKYQLIAQLAIGRLGTVYRAKIVGVEGFEKIVAVKAINLAYCQNQEFIDALVYEAQRVVSLSHANIAQVYDLGQEPTMNQYYIASEYVSGFDLTRLARLSVSAGRPVPLEIATFIIAEVAKGLDYAHRRKDFNFNNLNLAHRALSPENIMISFDGEVKLCDFGISRALEHITTVTTTERIRMHKYAAPEVARGDGATQRSDLFSLGLIFYELLTGTHPYDSDDPDEVLAHALSASVEPLHDREDIPRPISKIVDSMLVANPEGRAASAGTIFEDLISFIYNHSIRAETRAMSVLMQEMRRQERRLMPEDSTQEAGIDEISLSDLNVLTGSTREFDKISEATDAELPSHKLSDLIGDVKQPSLPGALEEYFNSVRAGSGKAVLVSGAFGTGRSFLADRLVDALGWRGNTMAYSTPITPDDALVPFGVLGRLIFKMLNVKRSNPDAAVKALRAIGGSETELEVFGSFWGIGDAVYQARSRKTALLVSLVMKFLNKQTANGPVALIFDFMEGIDDVSRDVLREIVRQISNKSIMLVMFTEASEHVRNAFDVGNRDALEAVNVMGTEPPTLEQVTGLDPYSEHVLAVIAMHGALISQSELGQITGLPSDQLMEILRDLTDRSFLRIPSAGDYLSGVRQLMVWAEALSPKATNARAGVIARHLIHRQRARKTRNAPTLVRLLALSGERTAAVQIARTYADWLEQQGWHDTALKFYEFVADVLSTRGVGSADTRIEFLLSRAELALDLSRLDVSQKTLEPIRALTEAHRYYRGSIRGLLLQGRLSMQQDDLEDAGVYFRRAIEAADSEREPDLFAKASLHLARWHMRHGDPVEAQSMLERAMAVFSSRTQYDLTTNALLLNRAVRLYAQRGMVTLAKRHLIELEAIEEAAPMPKIRCRVAWARAAIFTAEQNYGKAREVLARAEADSNHFGLTALHIELMRERASVSLLCGDNESAIRISDQLLPIARRYEDHYSVQRARDLRATASCLIGRDIDTALEHLDSSLRRAVDRGIPRDIYQCHLNLAKSFEAIGESARASEHLGAANRFAYQLRYSAVA